jgi:hypothetical protein
MKPKILHNEAMSYSFHAKQAYQDGNYSSAFDLYLKAANLESQVAEFYFDKPELEPTRSVLIRSAAFLNIKAGLIEEAKRFIFFGLLNTSDSFIKDQLNNALEIAITLGNMTSELASKEYNYINLLRLRSVHYVLEPAIPAYGHSVSLEMIKDFSENYLKSLQAYAVSKFKGILSIKDEIEETIAKEINKFINPLVTSSSYGSFKFSIANDFLVREGEPDGILELKANVITKYHNEIFINPLTDNDIEIIKKKFTEDEVNDIFRPLSKIKSNSTSYRVGYYDIEDLKKTIVGKIVNKQKQKLLTIKPISQEDIGELESSIIHKRSSAAGKIHRTTIRKELLKSFEFDQSTNQIEPKDFAPLILNEPIIYNVQFDSKTGFKISFEDFSIAYSDIEYEKTLKGLYDAFYQKIRCLARKEEKSEAEQKDWYTLKKLIGNIDSLTK